MKFYQTLIIIVVSLIYHNKSARILGFVPTPSYSHQIVFQPLWKELSLRGHQVTLLTTDPINNTTLTNLTEVDLSFSYRKVEETINRLVKANVIQSVKVFKDSFIELLDTQLEHHEVQKVLNGNPFDLVIAEYFSKIPFAIAEKFKCPSVAITSMAALETSYEDFGVPTHPVLYPSYMLPFTKASTISERVVSFGVHNIYKFYNRFFDEIHQNLVIKKHFGENASSAFELSRSISLLLENTEPVLGTVRPRVPTVIPIGGIHRLPPKPLPEDLQDILDSATNGFIYFSLGSNVKSSDLPETIRQTILETFEKMPYKILWKFELEYLPNKPKNVFISKWLPQFDVLNHPNIKLFITQGGLQSMEEAFIAKVPMVGIPYIADQGKNVKKMVEHGFGLSLDYRTLNTNQFKETILEVISNPKYQSTITKLSELSDDQPMPSLDLAIWWIEYVIRHRGTAHLRSPVFDLPLYQYYMIDVIGVICVGLVVLALLVFLLVYGIIKALKYALSKSTLYKHKKE